MLFSILLNTWIYSYTEFFTFPFSTCPYLFVASLSINLVVLNIIDVLKKGLVWESLRINLLEAHEVSKPNKIYLIKHDIIQIL